MVANLLLNLFFLSLLSSLALADKIQKKEYVSKTCYETLKFAECSYKNNSKISGSLDVNGFWNGNVKYESPTGNISYYFYRKNEDDKFEIGYGIKADEDGEYYGDLSSNGEKYGFGTYYSKNSFKYSFRNWHKEMKTGYVQKPSGQKLYGRFDKNFNQIIEFQLEPDFEPRMYHMVSLANSVKINFYKEHKKFLVAKNNFLSQNSFKKKKLIDSSSTPKKKIANSNFNKKSNNFEYTNILIGIFIFGIFIFFIWINPPKQKIKKDQPISDKNKKKRYKELSLADSKKIFSYGVKDFMSRPAACKVLRLEYMKWKTVSNNPNFVKKSYANRNLNEIVKLRSKLKC